MNVLTWHVHGSWTTAFVQGQHTYLIPVLPDRGPDGRGRAETYAWPEAVMELPPETLSSMDVDVVVLQRPHEWQLAESWLGRRLGRDVPVIYVEHNTPREDVVDSRHPMADRDDVTLIHVTHFNDLFWDAGGTRTAVIEHGIVEPATHFDGRLPHLAAVINEPVRRARITGTDLLPRFTQIAPIDLFGMGVRPLEGPGVSTRVETLTEAARWLVSDVDAAREMGRRARAAVLHRYGLHRFLSEWEYVLKEVAAP